MVLGHRQRPLAVQRAERQLSFAAQLSLNVSRLQRDDRADESRERELIAVCRPPTNFKLRGATADERRSGTQLSRLRPPTLDSTTAPRSFIATAASASNNITGR